MPGLAWTVIYLAMLPMKLTLPVYATIQLLVVEMESEKFFAWGWS
jgi:hypothetical protein